MITTFTNPGLKRYKTYINDIFLLILFILFSINAFHLFTGYSFLLNTHPAISPVVSRSDQNILAFTTVNIAFLPSSSTAPAGYIADNGLAYSDTQGYGWINPTTKAPQAMTANMRIRTGSSEKRLLGVVQMQASDKGQLPGNWEYAVPNGTYRITIGAGDEGYYDSNHQINVEGLPAVADLVTSSAQKHKISIVVVQVSDGKLTIDANGGENSKLNFITIAVADPVADTIMPTAGIRLAGTLKSPGVYTDQVQVFINGSDTGGSGLDSLKYSVNNAAYVNYTVPFIINTPGSYNITVKAVDANNNQTIITAANFSIPTKPIGINIAFLPSSSTAPTGYTADNGLAYSDTQGYGWVNPSTKAPQAMTANMRIRTGTSEKRLLGVVQMQASDKGQLPGSWEYAVPNGTYRVTIGAGDEGYYDSNHQINVEGFPAIADLTTSSAQKHKISIVVVKVSDGKLTIDANGGVNSKLNFVTVAPADPVMDTTAPTASVRLAGTIKSPGVYADTVKLFVTGADNGGAGLDSLKYSVNNAAFVNYTTPFIITTPGSYSIAVKAIDANNNQTIITASSFNIAAKQLGFNIAFLPSASTPPAGYLADNGLAYSDSQGYGWVNPTTKAPQSMTANMRIRTGTSEKRLLGLVQTQASDNGQLPGTWEYAVPNGKYRVTIGAGDEGYYDSDHQFNVEGLPVISDLITSSAQKHKIAVAVVQVSDGKLTIDANGGVNSKLNFVTVEPADTIVDTMAPTASVRLAGTLKSAGVYTDQVQVFINGTDNGNAGLDSLKYSMNNGAFVNYSTPITITTAGTYSVIVKAVDANNNKTITTAYNFSLEIPKAIGGYMVLQNPDAFPANDQLVFSLIQIPWRRTSPDTTPYNVNHDRIKLRINNKGSGKLTVNNLTLSNPTVWKIASVNTDTLSKVPFNVASKAFTDVTIQFIAKNAASRLKVFNDTLTINSTDSIAPLKKVALHGIWQAAGEGVNEPYAQQIINAFGFTSVTGYAHDDNNIDGTARVPSSSEVVANYFTRADASRPVTVHQVAAYHGCCSAVESIKYFAKGSVSNTTIFTHNNLDGQSVLPRLIGSNTNPAQGTFNPTGTFGLRVGSSSSDRTQNYNGLIGIRILKAMDGNGNIIPNAYFLDCDYLGTSFTNYDYQDNIYYIDNIKPDSGSTHYADLVALPKTAIDFASALSGSSTSFEVTLKNSGISYPDGTNDSPIALKSVKIVGPNAAEFSVGTLKTATLAVQATTTLTVKFNPNSVGIKNAALLVNYNSASAPLRIPLYGIGNNATSTVGVVKRIKGGSDVALTLGGNQYESDKNYRKGSIKLDKQTVLGPIAGSDIDSLYQTYLSAAADFVETRYDIPVPNGNYLVRMHFVENYWTAIGQRVFGITMENNLVLPNFDIFSEVGYRAALVKDFSTTVTDGVLNIKFNPTANRVGIAAVEIFQVQNTAPPTTALTTNNITSNLLGTTAKKITVYPNPSRGNDFHLNASNFVRNEKVTLLITNMSGKLLQTQTFVADESGSASVYVSLNNILGKGVYIISARSASGNLVSKLLVE